MERARGDAGVHGVARPWVPLAGKSRGSGNGAAGGRRASSRSARRGGRRRRREVFEARRANDDATRPLGRPNRDRTGTNAHCECLDRRSTTGPRGRATPPTRPRATARAAGPPRAPKNKNKTPFECDWGDDGPDATRPPPPRRRRRRRTERGGCKVGGSAAETAPTRAGRRPGGSSDRDARPRGGGAPNDAGGRNDAAKGVDASRGPEPLALRLGRDGGREPRAARVARRGGGAAPAAGSRPGDGDRPARVRAATRRGAAETGADFTAPRRDDGTRMSGRFDATTRAETHALPGDLVWYASVQRLETHGARRV